MRCHYFASGHGAGCLVRLLLYCCSDSDHSERVPGTTVTVVVLRLSRKSSAPTSPGPSWTSIANATHRRLPPAAVSIPQTNLKLEQITSTRPPCPVPVAPVHWHSTFRLALAALHCTGNAAACQCNAACQSRWSFTHTHTHTNALASIQLEGSGKCTSS